MKSSLMQIENLFNEKILLYHDLLDTIKEEKECLIKSNLDELWRISDRKHSLVSSVEKVRSQILDILNKESINHQMNISTFKSSKVISLLPKEMLKKIENIHISLSTIKEEVYSLTKANKDFIEDYLSVLDELIKIITTAAQPKPTYGKRKLINEKNKQNMLLHMEA